MSVPDWYWSSKIHMDVEKENERFLSENPCTCFNDGEMHCICVDGETIVDFCPEHGGINHDACMCCQQLPIIIK